MENKEKLISNGPDELEKEQFRIKPPSIRPSRSVSGVKSIKPICGTSLQHQEDQSHQKH